MIEYFFKSSKVKGNLYMQIWKRDNGREEYVFSLGSANGCFKKLVNAGLVSTQTNNNPDNPTNSLEGETTKTD